MQARAGGNVMRDSCIGVISGKDLAPKTVKFPSSRDSASAVGLRTRQARVAACARKALSLLNEHACSPNWHGICSSPCYRVTMRHGHDATTLNLLGLAGRCHEETVGATGDH
jgi:hypothetical protein